MKETVSHNCKSEIVRNCTKDGSRPSETALQEEVSNHSKLRWAKTRVVSVREKVSYKTSGKNQGDEAIEPLLKCRKRIDEIKTEGKSLTRDKLRRKPVYWLSGLRHRGGMNLIQAFVWNVGTCVLMLREKSKWKPHKDLSTKTAHRGGLTRNSDEAAEKQWSKGVKLSVL